MQHDHVLKQLNFDLLTSSSGLGEGGRLSASKIFATLLLHPRFGMHHDHVLKKLNFGLLTHPQGRGVSEGKICADMLLHSQFSLI